MAPFNRKQAKAAVISAATLPELKAEVEQLLKAIVDELDIHSAMDFTSWLRRTAIALDGYDLPEPSQN
jgi:hypothetical protein